MDIEIEGGGKRLIRVTDNGEGMDPDDAALAFSRHATSKLRCAGDLASVPTLGFRGEALASIAAVASIELRTRAAGSEAGTLVKVDCGGPPLAAECAAVNGTSITVSGLFCSLPARLKFLKSDAAEAARITDVVYSMALGNPGVSFSLRIGDDLVLRTQGTGSLADAVACLFGVSMLGDMLPVELEGETVVRVSGLAGKPSACRASRAVQYTFVNGRHIRSYAVRGATEEAYRGLIHGRRYPAFFLNIAIPLDWVDVNVHPQKTEVKFLRDRAVTSVVYSAVRRAVLGGNASSEIEGLTAATTDSGATALESTPLETRASRTRDSRGQYDGRPRPEGGHNASTGTDIASLLEVFSPPAAPVAGARREDDTQTPADAQVSLRDLKVIGQLYDSYLLAEGARGLVLVDQHAAHERVCYERLLAAQGGHATQALLSPEIMEMSPRDFERSLEILDTLARLGFEVESFGNNTLLIRGIPAGLDPGAANEMVMAVIGAASSAPRGSSPVELAAAALAACHSAVRAGRRLTAAEMTALIADLSAARCPLRCPHGRPTAVEIGIEEIEKRFGRR